MKIWLLTSDYGEIIHNALMGTEEDARQAARRLAIQLDRDPDELFGSVDFMEIEVFPNLDEWTHDMEAAS